MNRNIVLTTIMMLLLASCASPKEFYRVYKVPEAKSENSARFVILRKPSILGNAVIFPTVGEKKVCGLGKGEYTQFILPAGKYEIGYADAVDGLVEPIASWAELFNKSSGVNSTGDAGSWKSSVDSFNQRFGHSVFSPHWNYYLTDLDAQAGQTYYFTIPSIYWLSSLKQVEAALAEKLMGDLKFAATGTVPEGEIKPFDVQELPEALVQVH